MEMVNKEQRKRKSALLSREEHSSLKRLVASFPTVVDAAEAIGVNRQTLDRVLIIGKASPENINIIRQKLNRAA